jgi:hypothetical protein
MSNKNTDASATTNYRNQRTMYANKVNLQTGLALAKVGHITLVGGNYYGAMDSGLYPQYVGGQVQTTLAEQALYAAQVVNPNPNINIGQQVATPVAASSPSSSSIAE